MLFGAMVSMMNGAYAFEAEAQRRMKEVLGEQRAKFFENYAELWLRREFGCKETRVSVIRETGAPEAPIRE
jgi:hypothetical protein